MELKHISKNNLVDDFNADKKLTWRHSNVATECGKDAVVDSIKCLNQEYGEECYSDWLYNITLKDDMLSKPYMVGQFEIEVES